MPTDQLHYSICFNIPWRLDKNDIMREAGIYMIYNQQTNMFYIGSAQCFFRRYQHHRKELLLNIHYNKHLQNSFNKHGVDKFSFNIIELVEDNEILLNREQYWIDKLKPYLQDIGYNISDIAGPGMYKGKSLSEETKKKISDSLKGYVSEKRGTTLSKATKLKISNSVKKLKLKGNKLPQSRAVEIFNIKTGAKELFEAMSDIAKKYHIDRTTIIKYNNSGRIFKKTFKFKILI